MKKIVKYYKHFFGYFNALKTHGGRQELDIIVENNVAQISKFDLRFINEYLLITLLVMWL